MKMSVPGERKQYSQQTLKIKAMLDAGKSVDEIAATLNVPKMAVWKIRYYGVLPQNLDRRYKYDADTVDTVKYLRSLGRTYKEIAAELDIPTSTLVCLVRGYKRPKPRSNTGQSTPSLQRRHKLVGTNTRMSPDESARRDARIVELRLDGLSYAKIAKQAGCCIATVYRVINDAGITTKRSPQP